MREPSHPPWVLLRMLQRVAQRRAPTPSVAAEEAVAALYPSRLGSQRSNGARLIHQRASDLSAAQAGARHRNWRAPCPGCQSWKDSRASREPGALGCTVRQALPKDLRGLLAATSMSSLHHGIPQAGLLSSYGLRMGPFVQVARLNILPIAISMQAPMNPAIK